MFFSCIYLEKPVANRLSHEQILFLSSARKRLILYELTNLVGCTATWPPYGNTGENADCDMLCIIKTYIELSSTRSN